MNILIGTNSVHLNFKNEQEALNTRARITVAFDELGLNGYFRWCALVNKYPAIANAYLKATGRAK